MNVTKLDIISGFLGSGKTTFANKLLSHYIAAGKKPVYIANELGQAVLDAKIIESNGFTAMEMEGGCICCSLKHDVSTTVAQVIDAFAPDVIVFEPSGIFVFDNFIEIVKGDELRSKCEIGNVFTIVDGINFNAAKVLYGSFIYNQIKNAPVLFISKFDKTDKDPAEIICDVKNINPKAFIATTAQDAILANRPTEMPNVQGKHSHSFKAKTITSTKSFTAADIESLSTKKTSGEFGDVYRIKGIVNVDGALMLLNIALHDMTLTPHKGIGETAVTFIGSDVNLNTIENFFCH